MPTWHRRPTLFFLDRHQTTSWPREINIHGARMRTLPPDLHSFTATRGVGGDAGGIRLFDSSPPTHLHR